MRRYRTQLCNDGLGCRRRVCFFAHTLQELRVPSSKPFVNPETLAAVTAAAAANEAAKTEDALKLQQVCRRVSPQLHRFMAQQ
jgi:hypothetical protein